MPSFQGSFEDRIGKFINGNTLVQSYGDYDPGKRKSGNYIEYNQAIKGS